MVPDVIKTLFMLNIFLKANMNYKNDSAISHLASLTHCYDLLGCWSHFFFFFIFLRTDLEFQILNATKPPVLQTHAVQ